MAPPLASAETADAPFVPERVTGEGRAMGTHLAYAAFTTPALDAAHVRALFDAATAEIVRLEKLMTTWDPASEVSRVNAAAGKEPVVVGPETFDVIREALHASAISDGTFDITFETLHGLWKFDQDLDPHPPTAAAVHAQVQYVGYKHVKIDPAASTVFLDESHVRIGLGGIAKGYAVDRASKVLLDGGIVAFYAQAGGDLYAHGLKPDGSPWIAGIRDPRGPENDYFATMPVSDHAFSTAGDYERSYLVGNRRYHHIIDPRTGYPATASRSVTIWATNALHRRRDRRRGVHPRARTGAGPRRVARWRRGGHRRRSQPGVDQPASRGPRPPGARSDGRAVERPQRSERSEDRGPNDRCSSRTSCSRPGTRRARRLRGLLRS